MASPFQPPTFPIIGGLWDGYENCLADYIFLGLLYSILNNCVELKSYKEI